LDKITIMRKIVVKQIVTEDSKKKAAFEIQEAIKKVEQDIDNFEKDTKKTVTELTLKGHPQIEQVKRQVAVEKEKLSSYKNQLLERLKVISKLNIGDEIVQGNIESPVEVKIGDDFEKLNQTEMVLKDGVVVEIR